MNILLIWDIDGTLINCMGVGRKAMNAAFFTKYGVENGFDKVPMAGRLDKAIIHDAMLQHGMSDLDIEAFYQAYSLELMEQMDLHKPYVHDGIEEILMETNASGRVLNAVGTGNCKVGADLKLKFTGLFEYIRLGGYGSSHAERAELIKGVINESETWTGGRFSKESIFVIGDTPRDIMAGKANGVKTIALETGGYSKDELEMYQPDYIFSSLLTEKNAFYEAIRLI